MDSSLCFWTQLGEQIKKKNHLTIPQSRTPLTSSQSSGVEGARRSLSLQLARHASYKHRVSYDSLKLTSLKNKQKKNGKESS